ncbi:hypothetical protein N9O95_04735 [Alphaproteobacteria bacterium]|nr:hypothetical protein [Alphaproteobacteria bacterium]
MQQSKSMIGLAVFLMMLALVPRAWGHEADLNNRVTFFVTSVEQTQVQGESAIILRAVLDNGTRNRITLRGLSSDAGDTVTLYSVKRVYGLETLLPRRTLALRSGQGVELGMPEYALVISELSSAAQFRKPFTLNLVFNRAIGELDVPVTFLRNEELEHGRGVIDLGPPAALAEERPAVEWLTTDDIKDASGN